MATTEPGGQDRGDGQKPDRLWAVIVIVALSVVVVVNATFIYIAVSGADDVDPAYVEGER